MTNTSEGQLERALDPVARISEVMFGLIMAVTIVGSLEIATAGRNEARTVMIAALGCNLAWGLVDAFMYLIQTATERTRNRVLAKRITGTDRETGDRLIREALPEHVAALAGPHQVEDMRRLLLELKLDRHAVLGPRDLVAATYVFLLVVIATFPVVVPYMLADDLTTAKHWSQTITLVMLFLAGFGLGRYAGYAKPLATGLLMAVFGALLIGAVIALGG